MVKNFVSFLPIWILDKILTLMPRSWAISFVEELGAFLSLFFGRRRELMMKNLTAAFPEKTEAEKKTLIQKVWRNIGTVAGEFIRLSDINRGNFRDYMEVVGEDLLVQAKAENKGIILVGFHYGNWEMSGVGGNQVHPNLVAIARPIKNKWVEKWVQRKRGLGSMNIILHRDAVRGCLRALKEKKAVGILVDQNLYQGGVFVNFFGRPAASTTLPALLHSRTGAPVLILYCEREEDKLKLIFKKTSAFPKDLEKKDAVHEITQIISSDLESIIRKHPEQWFWVHNRWKRQPELNGTDSH